MQKVLTSGEHPAGHYGAYELVVRVRGRLGNPYTDTRLQVAFTRPDGSRVMADAFYDGADVYRARAYCGQAGSWSWQLVAEEGSELEPREGGFQVTASSWPGKLRLHPEDARQFAYDNGAFFLHIGDTGYRYATDTEPYWREYLEQAAAAGFTKIRVWFCQGRSDVQALFQSDRTRLNLSYWQEMDRRIIYALNHHPELQLQLIPFGEDEQEVLRYGEGDASSRLALRYAIARFSALPNVQWCFTNDLRLESGEETIAERGDAQRIELAHRLKASIRMIGDEVARLEPWGTLLTNHQSRFSGYSFTEEPWSQIITLEDLGQVTGEIILRYRQLGQHPVVLDEDRYEHWKAPKHARYFFRRLLWSCLLSGGHVTYGGLHTYRPFDGALDGIYGYQDACREGKLAEGAHDFIHIHRFFEESGFSLTGAVPSDELAGDQPMLYKALRSRDGGMLVVYLANPTVYEGHRPEGFGGVYTDALADVSAATPSVTLRGSEGDYHIRWFNPMSGAWTRKEHRQAGGDAAFTAPSGGDWVLLLLANSKS